MEPKFLLVPDEARADLDELLELNAQIAGMLSDREEVAAPNVDERIRRLHLQAAALMRTKARASLEPLVKEAEDAAKLARALLGK